MADPIARAQAEASDWPGLMTNLGSQVKEAGAAAAQINLQSNTPGELHVRPGIREIRFEQSTITDEGG